MQLRTILYLGALSTALAARPAVAQDRPGSPSAQDPLGRDTTPHAINDTAGRGPNAACDTSQIATTAPGSPSTGAATVSPRPCGAIIRDTAAAGAGTARDTTGMNRPGNQPQTPGVTGQPPGGTIGGTTSNPPNGSPSPGTGTIGGTSPSGNPPIGGTVSSPPPTPPR